MAWKLTIGGVDQTAIVDSFTTTVTLNDRARATVVVADFMPARYAELVSYAADGVTPLFGGVILQRSLQGRTQYDSTYQLSLEVGDWLTYADWCYATKVYPAPVTLKHVLADLVADHLAPYGITLDPVQVDGPTIAPFTWTDKRVADALRELSDRTTFVVKIDPGKRLRMFAPGSILAPVMMTEATPHCHELTWHDGTRTPYNRIILRCGPNGAGDPVPYHWIGNGGHVYSLKGVAVPASPIWPGIVTVAGVFLPIWPPGEGPADRIEWDYTLNDGTVTFIGAAGAYDTPGADILITYAPQFPFTVTKSTGATPIVEHLEDRPDVLALPVAEEIATTLLAQAQEAPREATITTDQDGFIPGQALTIALATTRSIAGTFLVSSVGLTIVQDTDRGDRHWQYTLEAVESGLYQGSYLDGWREIAGGGGGSTTVTGGGGGLPAEPLPALPPAAVFIGDAGSVARAHTFTGAIGLTDLGVTSIANGVITNGHISATAGIVDSKLATIATPGKVANSATTATDQNVAGAIVSRDVNGEFFCTTVLATNLYGFAFVYTPLIKSNANIDIEISPGNGGGGHLRLTPSLNIWLDPFNVVVLRDTKPLTSSTVYASGFGGAGFTLNQGQTFPGRSYLELDQLRVRGAMNVYELVVNQIRSTNGNLFVSNCARVAAGTSQVNGNYYDIFTEAPHGFQPNDLIRAQRFSAAGGGAAVFQTDIIVNALGSDVWFGGTVLSGPPPAPGMDFVRLGNTTDPNRQGSIYLTADDINAPYLNVLNGVNSVAAWGQSSTLRVRLGNLVGSYGYTGAPVYGLAAGAYPGAWFSIDAVNGLRMSYGSTVYMQIDTTGNAMFSGKVHIGAVTIDQSGIRILPAGAGGWDPFRSYYFDVPLSYAQIGLGYIDHGAPNTGWFDLRLQNKSTSVNGEPRRLTLNTTGFASGTNADCEIALVSDGNVNNTRIDFVTSMQLSAPITTCTMRLGVTGLIWGPNFGNLQKGFIPTSDHVARVDLNNIFTAAVQQVNGQLAVYGIARFSTACYFDGLIQAQSTSPNIQSFKLDGAVNEKYTRWLSDAAEYDLQFVDDGYSVAPNGLRITRSQHVLATVERGDNYSMFNVVSDMNAKTNIRPVSRATQRELLRAIQIYEFDYTGDFGIKVGPGIGPLAQEVITVFPNSVQTILRARDSKDADPAKWSAREPLLVFNPDTLFMAHVAYTQALDEEVEALKARVLALEGG